MLKKNIIKLLSQLLLPLWNYYFFQAAINGDMITCYISGGVLLLITFVGFIQLCRLNTKQIAYIMKLRGHNWLLYPNAIVFSYTLLILDWRNLFITYITLVLSGVCIRLKGYFELRHMTEDQLKALEKSIIQKTKA